MLQETQVNQKNTNSDEKYLLANDISSDIFSDNEMPLSDLSKPHNKFKNR